ncbi:MAG TPA: hypothetical protein VFZ09_12635 [Archangium sp.]|nr:hypothetical protein [Archangium sp.]HEX5747082.1 hypothetical protein [Archangium sp.]
MQGTRGVPLLWCEAGACDGDAPGGAGAAARALPAVDAVFSAPGPVGAAQGRGTALGRPHRLPARSVCPAVPKGTAAGPARWAGRGRVVHPVLRLRLAGDSALPLAGAGRCLRRTFAVEVLACVRCGGRRRVLVYVKEAAGVRAILEHLGLPTAGARLAPARGPPRPRGVEAQAARAKRARPQPRTPWERGLDSRVPQGAARPVHPLGSLLGRPLSAVLLGTCAPALTLNMASIPPIRSSHVRAVAGKVENRWQKRCGTCYRNSVRQ